MDEMQRAFNRTTSRLSANARKAGENEEKQEVALDLVTQKTAKLQKDVNKNRPIIKPYLLIT